MSDDVCAEVEFENSLPCIIQYCPMRTKTWTCCWCLRHMSQLRSPMNFLSLQSNKDKALMDVSLNHDNLNVVNRTKKLQKLQQQPHELSFDPVIAFSSQFYFNFLSMRLKKQIENIHKSPVWFMIREIYLQKNHLTKCFAWARVHFSAANIEI